MFLDECKELWIIHRNGDFVGICNGEEQAEGMCLIDEWLRVRKFVAEDDDNEETS